jgi:hypothetical protein
MIGLQINDKLGRIWKEMVVVYIINRYLGIFLDWLRKTSRNLRITGFLAEIQNEYKTRALLLDRSVH